MQSSPQTLARTDIDTLLPARLADVNYHLLEVHADVTHRGHDVDVNRLISRLGAALDHAAVDADAESAPSPLSELAAVDVVLDALVSRVPRWFGRDAALDAYDEPVSNRHLDVSELRSAYWNDELAPATMPVAGDDWTDQKRVIVAVLALAWERLAEQRAADRTAAVEAGQAEIVQTIRKARREQELSTSEIEAAVEDALGKRRSRQACSGQKP